MTFPEYQEWIKTPEGVAWSAPSDDEDPEARRREEEKWETNRQRKEVFMGLCRALRVDVRV